MFKIADALSMEDLFDELQILLELYGKSFDAPIILRDAANYLLNDSSPTSPQGRTKKTPPIEDPHRSGLIDMCVPTVLLFEFFT